MKIIAGWVQPDSGTVEIGQTVKLGYFSQENEAMDESLKVIDYIRNAAEYVKTKDGSISASQMLERFLFPSSMQYTPSESFQEVISRKLLSADGFWSQKKFLFWTSRQEALM